MPRLPRRLVPRAVAAAVALVGALLAGLGALFATTLAPQQQITARLDGTGDAPVVTTQIGLLSLEGPRVQVKASADGGPVFLGIGRAKDVEAYLGNVKRVEIAGHDAAGRLLADQAGEEGTVPDPAGVDVWTVSTRTENSANLVWPQAEGQWRLVAATDGKAQAPATVEITWTGEKSTSVAPALIAVGILLVVGGGVTFAMLWSRSSLNNGPPPPTRGHSPRREARQGMVHL